MGSSYTVPEHVEKRFQQNRIKKYQNKGQLKRKLIDPIRQTIAHTIDFTSQNQSPLIKQNHPKEILQFGKNEIMLEKDNIFAHIQENDDDLVMNSFQKQNNEHKLQENPNKNTITNPNLFSKQVYVAENDPLPIQSLDSKLIINSNQKKKGEKQAVQLQQYFIQPDYEKQHIVTPAFYQAKKEISFTTETIWSPKNEENYKYLEFKSQNEIFQPHKQDNKTTFPTKIVDLQNSHLPEAKKMIKRLKKPIVNVIEQKPQIKTEIQQVLIKKEETSNNYYIKEIVNSNRRIVRLRLNSP